uniref:SWIM-type domain-containing protein n=1 Tax=Heterosigma akashiwo TaxID=2829 RepID=A0A7S3XT45_HETAK
MDDDEQMSEAIKNVLTPDQVLAGALIILRCVFHTLKAIWAWMWEKKNGMEKEHRPLIMGAVRKMMFAKTKFECLIWCIIAIQRAKKLAAPQKLTYPKAFKEYLLTKYSRRQEMCVAYRKGLLTRGQNTNNISERAVRTVKEDAFMRILSYNPVTVVDVLTNEFEEHFRSKLKDVANNRHPAQLTIPREYAVLKDRVKHISAADIKISKDPLWTHVVPSSSTEGVFYHVNMILGICECPQGDNGSLCKHQLAVHLRHGAISPTLPASVTNIAVSEAWHLLGKSAGNIPSFFLQAANSTSLTSVASPFLASKYPGMVAGQRCGSIEAGSSNSTSNNVGANCGDGPTSLPKGDLTAQFERTFRLEQAG